MSGSVREKNCAGADDSNECPGRDCPLDRNLAHFRLSLTPPLWRGETTYRSTDSRFNFNGFTEAQPDRSFINYGVE